jgi:hypothetical protein
MVLLANAAWRIAFPAHQKAIGWRNKNPRVGGDFGFFDT